MCVILSVNWQNRFLPENAIEAAAQILCRQFEYNYVTLLFLRLALPIIPSNAKHLYNICTTSAQRLRRRSSIVQMLYKCVVLAGMGRVLSNLNPFPAKRDYSRF